MIGDIDLLISEKEKNKTIRLLNKNNYYNVIDYKYRSNRHLPRFRNSRKNFAVEIHTKLFDKEKYNINISKFLENPQSQIINYAILNYQINDYATLKSMFSYRTMHDYFCLSRHFKNSQKKSQNNHIKIFLNFISILENNGLKKIKLNLQNRIIINRYFLKRKYFIFYKIDEIICEILIRVPVFFDQMMEFLINKNYRFFFLKRLFKIINKVIEVRK